MTAREKLLNPPIRLVSFELRFPIRRRLATRIVWDAFEEVFASDLPLVELLAQEDDETQLPTDSNDPIFRRRTSERDWAVTLRYGALTVETTAYSTYEGLRARIDAAVKALESVPATLSFTRLGLRFINEIRVPGLRTIADWKPYINPSLLLPAESQPPGLSASWMQAGLGFHSTAGKEHAYAAYGPLPSSSLEPDGVLQLKEQSGPCFMLDIDSFLAGSPKLPVAATRKEVLDVVDRLHDSVEAIFDWSITPRLRDEVLRPPTAEESKKNSTPGGSGG